GSFNYCGNDSCSSAIFESSPSYVQTSEGTYITETLVQGYNRILYSPRSIKKGDILMIIDSNKILAVNDTNDFTIMGDYYINGAISRKLNKNWRFYVNLLIDVKFFISYFPISKRYTTLKNGTFGVYTIRARFSNTSLQLKRRFNITEYRSIDMFCSDTNKTINNTVNCAIIASTRSRNDTVLVENNQLNSFSGEPISYFGFKVPNNITEPVSFFKNGDFLLPLTEAKFDANLIGFEGYALGTGTYTTFIATLNSCGEKDTCLKSIINSEPNSPISNNQFLIEIPSVYGYNRFYLQTTRKILKGQMLVVRFTFPVAIDTTNDYLASDYQISGSELIKLNPKHNWRIYFNWIIEQEYYLNYFYFKKTFHLESRSLYGVFNVTASYLNSNTSVTQIVNITNNQAVDFKCQNSHGASKNTINCTAELISQSQFHEFIIDYGDCSNGSVTNKGELFDGFGVNIPDNINTTINPTNTGGIMYLLTNTEFLFDSKLIGFEFYLSVIGSFNLALNKMSNCGTGILAERCGIFLESFTSTNLITINNWFLNPTTMGRNFYWLDKPYNVKKGYILSLSLTSLGRISLDDKTDNHFQDYYFNGAMVTKIDANKKLKFLFKALTTNSYFYSHENIFSKTYDFDGTYDITLLDTKKKVFVTTSCK
ncbi:unnamed protein product, partial [Brachionus calyciflorus]